MTINVALNIIPTQRAPFFAYIHWALSVGIFNVYISRLSKFNSIKPTLCIRFWSGKYTFTPQRWCSRTGKIDILFLRKICLHLVYYMFCSQLDTNLALIQWTIIPMFHFYIPWKQKKTFGFLAFSGSTEMEHRAKMG